MSRLRPTLCKGAKDDPCLYNGTAYYAIFNAVRDRHGLIHGKLEDHGEYCAIGSFFHNCKGTSLPTDIVDEVAAVNDSMPHATAKQRQQRVLQWLRWKLRSLGFEFAGRKGKEQA
jgi:hypothetical protein